MFSTSTEVHSCYTQHTAFKHISRAARPWLSAAANSWQHIAAAALGDFGESICLATTDYIPISGYRLLSQRLATEHFSASKQPGSSSAIPTVDRIGPLRFLASRKYLI